jgi:hypothetical protein
MLSLHFVTKNEARQAFGVNKFQIFQNSNFIKQSVEKVYVKTQCATTTYGNTEYRMHTVT